MPKSKTIPTCHPQRPHEAKGLCSSCYHGNRRKNLGESYLAYSRNRYKTLYAERRKTNGISRKFVLKKYGLSQKQYLKILKNQNNHCKLCPAVFGNIKRETNLFVDHNHQTGKVRGLLCGPCNSAVGVIDRGVSLESIKNYLNEQ